jgi:hypothetical protein
MKLLEKFRARLLLPEFPDQLLTFNTKSGTVLAEGYTRVVIGERGPYLEFNDDQIAHSNLIIPRDQQWRFDPQYPSYYREYRSNDNAWVKVYHQTKVVSYADYKTGLWYVSPVDLITDSYPILYQEVMHKAIFSEENDD